MNNESSNIDLNEKVKFTPEFEGYSDEEIDNILMALETFSVLLFDLYYGFKQQNSSTNGKENNQS